MAQHNIEQWYLSIPIITRTYLTLTTLTSLAVTFDLLSPLHLYLNFGLVFKNWELWRLVTNFVFFDRFSVNLVFHVYFLYFYCRRLEEHSFQGKTADFLFMMLFGAGSMLLCAPFIDLPFLSHSLVIMILYVWSRRNPFEQLQLYGLFTVGAGYLAYIMAGLSILMGQPPIVDLLGIAIGHIYYVNMDVIPVVYDVRPIKTPKILAALFPHDNDDDIEDVADYYEGDGDGNGDDAGEEEEHVDENLNVHREQMRRILQQHRRDAEQQQEEAEEAETEEPVAQQRHLLSADNTNSSDVDLVAANLRHRDVVRADENNDDEQRE